jgi:FkbM family methyltransferase
VERIDSTTVRFNDAANFYVTYKDIFVRRIYHFDSVRPDPVILDCGSNIGMAILYFKRVYPDARITGFEADPEVFRYLAENVERNKLTNVQLVQAALSASEGFVSFDSDAKYGSHIAGAEATGTGWRRIEVPTVSLRDYLAEPVDFLKMNIEAAEWEVLADAADHLRAVRELVIEYHHLPGVPRTLHHILALLDQEGFEYLLNDFDSETNSGVRAPFHLDEHAQYFLLIYGKRRD